MTVRLLRDVLDRIDLAEAIDPSKVYPTMGVRSFGRGAFAAQDLKGSDTRYSALSRVERDLLVYPKLMAWEGAFAVVPQSLHGRYVSPEFVLFRPRADLDPAYLAHLVAWEGFRDGLLGFSTGTNARRRRLQPDQLLDLEVPLPGIDEQRYIAAHLDGITRYVSRVQTRTNVGALRDAWLAAVFGGLGPTRRLGEVAAVTRGSTLRLSEDGVGAIGQASVRWDGVDARRLKMVDAEWASLQPDHKRVREGDVLLNSTGEGTIGRACLATPGQTGLLTDSKVLLVRTSANLAPGFLALYLRSPEGRAAIESAKGANTTNQTELGLRRTSDLRVPVPTRSAQATVISRWEATGPSLTEADRLTHRRDLLLKSVLPAARNEIFSAMR